jgi:hypothetical protein
MLSPYVERADRPSNPIAGEPSASKPLIEAIFALLFDYFGGIAH